MKKLLLITVISIVFTSLNSFGITYTTINDGDWDDVTNVWSTDGINPCGCMPTEPSAGNDILVQNTINHNSNVTITGGSELRLEAYIGQMLGATNEVDVQNGLFYANGDIDIDKLTVGTNGLVTIIGFITLQIHNTLEVRGTMNLVGGYLYVSSGNVKVFNGGSFVLNNYSKIELANGNLNNGGYIYIEGTCCVETHGKWTNDASGVLEGAGSAQSVGGNMTNNGTWDVGITWCSDGNDTGITSPENCGAASTTCGLIVLGVSFGDLVAEVNGVTVDIVWNTITERDNSHFIVQRTSDGMNYESIGMLEGAGTTSETNYYSFNDITPLKGTSYYRLKQVDFNGNVNYSLVVSAVFGQVEGTIIGTYNMMGQEVNTNYTGFVIDQYSDGTSQKRYQN